MRLAKTQNLAMLGRRNSLEAGTAGVGLRVMQARWVASRRLGFRGPSLAHAHPPRGARHAVDAFGTPETDLAEGEHSGLRAAAASTRGVWEDLIPLAGSLAAAAVAAAATVEASATPCRRPPGRRMFVWLLLALLLAPARAGCPGFTQQKNCGWGDCGAGCQNNEPAAIAADSSGANDKSVCLSWCDGLLPRQNIRNRNA